jgi:GNAT superfamily N-acetyltransferase
MTQAILGRRIAFKSPTEPELPACRILLPEVFRWGTAPDFVLASSQNPLRFLGGAAWVVGRRRSDGRPLLKVALRVAGPHRGQGIGTQLLDRLEAVARRRRIDVLSASADIPRDRDWADFLVARGFRPVLRLHTFEADARRMADFFISRRDLLAHRGKIPGGASIVPVRDVPARRVAEFFAAHLGGIDDQVDSHLRSRADGTTDSLGYALLIAGVPQAALLHRLDGSTATIDALAVSPSLRGEGARVGWANMMITAKAFEHYSSNGIERVRYVISESNRMVMKQYLRFEPREIEVREYYERTVRLENAGSS